MARQGDPTKAKTSAFAEAAAAGAAPAARKIITTFVYPPIPVRSFDWQAHYEDDEPDDSGHMKTGEGATEAEAIADLVENDEDEEDE